MKKRKKHHNQQRQEPSLPQGVVQGAQEQEESNSMDEFELEETEPGLQAQETQAPDNIGLEASAADAASIEMTMEPPMEALEEMLAELIAQDSTDATSLEAALADVPAPAAISVRVVSQVSRPVAEENLPVSVPPVEEPVAEPVAQITVAPVSEPVEEKIAAASVTPVAELVAEPVAEAVPEVSAAPAVVAEAPAVEPVAEHVAEVAAAPIAEPIADPVADAIADVPAPVFDSVSEEIPEPVAAFAGQSVPESDLASVEMQAEVPADWDEITPEPSELLVFEMAQASQNYESSLEALSDATELPITPAAEQHALDAQAAELESPLSAEDMMEQMLAETISSFDELEYEPEKVVVEQAAAPAVEEVHVPVEPLLPQPPLEAVMHSIDEALETAPAVPRFEGTTPAAYQKQFSQLDDFVVFTLSGTDYAVPVRDVAEIGRVPQITRVPNLPEFVRGITNLRGEVVPVLSLPTLLGLQDVPQSPRSRVLFLQSRSPISSTGLIVDEVKGIQRIQSQQLEQVSGLIDDKVTSVLRGVHGRGDRLLNILDLEQLFQMQEFQQLET